MDQRPVEKAIVTELEKTIEKFGLDIPAQSLPKLDLYCNSVWQFNKRLNLTRHTDYDKFVSRDLVDTVELSKLIPNGKQVLDIGSGGGVPGMTLAILRPDLEVTLVESVGKKTAALNEIAECCQVELNIFQSRAETLLEDFRFDFTTARAVGPLVKICRWLADCWPNVGTLLAVKGPRWPAERTAAEEEGLLKHVEIRVAAEYPTPGTDWKSVILALSAKRAAS